MAVKRLGKGLGALIPDLSSGAAEGAPAERLFEIEVASVRANPFQPRMSFDPTALEELKQSISENGVIQPITVRNAGSGYELIAGERRLRAVSELGRNKIPAYVLDVTTDQEMIELSLIENIQRENLNPIDEANGYRTLIAECDMTQDEVARQVGKDRSTITNFLRLLKLPQQIQESVAAEELTQGHARALLAVEDRGEQISLWKKALKHKYSVRKLESTIKGLDKKATKPKKATEVVTVSPYVANLEGKFRDAFGTQVRIHEVQNSGTGKIEIEFYATADLERFSDLLDAL